MTDDQIIRALDEVEARMRQMEHRIFACREALRDRIDPHKRRKDLGWWPDETTTVTNKEPR